MSTLREEVAELHEDRDLSPDLGAAARLVASGALTQGLEGILPAIAPETPT
jgi:histidine ammonia-lyase